MGGGTGDGGITLSDEIHNLLGNRRYEVAFDYLMENPKAMDGLPIYELRLIYHQCFQGLVPEEKLSQLFQKLEERVKSTDI